MEECKPAKLPMIDGLDCMQGDALDQVEATTYREMVGSLLYVAVNTRPDISYGVSTLSKKMARPYSQHMSAAKHFLKYLQGTKDLGIVFGQNQEEGLQRYVVSDWASDKSDRKSRT
eukprot:105302-Chlamydomonas_euryale.AAC.1